MDPEKSADEQFLSVAEVDLQRARQPKRPRVSYRGFNHPELTSAPVELSQPRRDESRHERREHVYGAPSVVEKCDRAVRGALYDLLHFSELPEVHGSKIGYILGRDGRAPLLAGCAALLLLFLWVLCLAFRQ
jgi:hypothetical protein